MGPCTWRALLSLQLQGTQKYKDWKWQSTGSTTTQVSMMVRPLLRGSTRLRPSLLRSLHTTNAPPRSTWARRGAIALPLTAAGLYALQSFIPLRTETPDVVSDDYVPFSERPSLPPIGSSSERDIALLAKAHLMDMFSEHVPDLLNLPGRPYRSLAWSDLLGRYMVFFLCSFPSLIDASPGLLDWAFASSIPGVKSLAEWVVRCTFFKQVRLCFPNRLRSQH